MKWGRTDRRISCGGFEIKKKKEKRFVFRTVPVVYLVLCWWSTCKSLPKWKKRKKEEEEKERGKDEKERRKRKG